MLTRSPSGWLLVAAGGVLAALALIVPLGLLWQVITDGGQPWTVFGDARLWGYFGRSVVLALAVGSAATVVGVTAAWCVERIAMPRGLRRALVIVGCVPIAIPSYVAAFGLIVATGDGGAASWALPDGVYLRDAPFVAAWLVLSSCTFPYVFLPARSALLRQCGSLEEAAIGLGASRWHATMRITLPRIAPAALGGGLLAALYALADFGAVSLLNCRTMTWAIYHRYSTAFGIEEARAMALVLAVTALVFLAITRVVQRRATPGTVAPTIALTRLRWHPGFIVPAVLCLVPLVIGAVLPLTAAVQWSAVTSHTSAAWARLVAHSMSTIILAVAAAACITVLVLPMAGLVLSRMRRLAGVVSTASLLGFALPGLVVAIAAVGLGLTADRALEAVTGWEAERRIYQSVGLLLFAYAVMFLSESIMPVRASAEQIQHEQLDAARQLDGRSWPRWRRIILPQLAPGLVAGAALVFLTTAKELPATLILAPPNVQTLATSIWMNTEEALFADAALASLALVVIASVALAVVLRFEARGAIVPRAGRRDA